MDATRDGTAEDTRVAQIRSDIVAARARVVQTLDALEYKAGVPARLADVLGSAASDRRAGPGTLVADDAGRPRHDMRKGPRGRGPFRSSSAFPGQRRTYGS